MKINASGFIKELKKHQSAAEQEKYEKYFPPERRNGDIFIGVKMGEVFSLAKKFIEMPLNEIEKLLKNSFHEVRVGAVSIMDFQARDKKTIESRKKELFDLYIRRHDRINNWDLVDRAAPSVVGGYLFYGRPRDILYKLAISKNIWERRTSIVSTAYFIRQGETDDNFKIAESLLKDKEDFIHKAAGWMLRYAGDKDRQKLLNFLDKYSAVMPRTLLRNAVEKLSKKEKDYYLNVKKEL